MLDLDAEFIAQWAQPVSPAQPGIYFLLKDDEIVYIGQSVAVETRLGSHLAERKKEFNRWFWIPCPQQNLLWVEAHFIKRFKPKYNKEAGPGFRGKQPRAGLFKVGNVWHYRFRVVHQWIESSSGTTIYFRAEKAMNDHRKRLREEAREARRFAKRSQAEIDEDFRNDVRASIRAAKNGQRKKRTA